MSRTRPLYACLALLAGLAIPREATAAPPPCNTLPNPVYLQVGDTQEPLMKVIGKHLRDSKVNPITLIYKTAGSCTNIDAIYNNTKLTTNPFYVPSAAEDPTWDPSKPSLQCTIDPAGVNLDVANSNVFISACTMAAPPAGIGVFLGHVQPYLFIVPKASTQKAITAEEAYFVFGFGASGKVTPWNDEAFMFIRPATKSTLLSVAANIDVPAAKWKGVPLDKSSEVLNSVATSASPEKTIGILGAEIYDQNRSKVSSLAFQAYKQKHAFYADSTSTATDKRNLRDGHYLIWSPTVYMAPVDAQGNIKNPLAKYVVDLILGKTPMPTPDFDPLVDAIGVGLVPDCAMKVTRSFEGGDLSLYTPKEPCGCYFESKVGKPGASCVACANDTTCGGGKCRYGFCEAQ